MYGTFIIRKLPVWGLLPSTAELAGFLKYQ